MTEEFSQQFASYVQGVQWNQTSSQELETAKLAILDFLGTTLAGIGEGPDHALWDRISQTSGHEASIIGKPQKTTSWLAALMNGTLGHSLDYDDTAEFGHASVIIVPALLASGERFGCSGSLVSLRSQRNSLCATRTGPWFWDPHWTASLPRALPAPRRGARRL